MSQPTNKPAPRLMLTEGNVATFAEAKPDQPRRFEMVAYTGAEMSAPLIGKIVVDLAGLNPNGDRKPIFRQHDPDRIAGHSDRITKDGQLVMSGTISRKTEAGREVTDLADEGFPWQASMGIDIHEFEAVKAGKSVEVNGRSFEGPGLVARRSTLKESSFVPLGADGATSAVVFADNGASIPLPTQENEPMTLEQFQAFAAENPSAVEGFINQGYEKAKAELAPKPATVEELKNTFGAESGFIVDQIGKGNSLLAARAEFADHLKAKLESAEKSAGELQARLDKVGAAGSEPLNLNADKPTTAVDPAKIEDPKARAEAEWDSNPDVRQGFSSKERYVAIRKAELTGQFRMTK